MRTKFILVSLSFVFIGYSESDAQLSKSIFKLSNSEINNKNFSADTIKTFNPTLITTATATTAIVADSNDIRVFSSANEQSEVHISICRSNPSNLIISANTYTTTHEQGYYVSNNCGRTWTGNDALFNTTTVDGDPSTGFGANGNAFISTITDAGDGYFIERSLDHGVTWSNPIRGVTSANFDKEMIVLDDQPNSPYLNYLYCAWSTIQGLNSTVNFNHSTDGAQNFSQAITLKNGCGQGVNVQTGINGEVYVCWADFSTCTYPANGIGFTLSTNGGSTFSTSRVAFSISGIATSAYGNSLFGNIGVNDFPSMSVDKSNSSYRGRIYITYPTKENGNGKAIIQVRYSDDKGTTWSSAQTISIPNGLQSFFPWISVDPLTGIVSIIYYSFDSSSGFSTNTYVAYSFDGGVTYSNLKVSDVSHTTAPINNNIHRSGYAGDYIGITSYGSVAYPAWMDNRNGTWQVYVSRINYMNITGSTIVCSSGSSTFTVNNLPTGATVTWSYSSNLKSVYGGTNFIALVSNGVGTGWVQARINTACTPIILAPFNIQQVGLAASFTGPTWIPLNTNGTFTSSASCGPTPYSYSWWIRQNNGQGSYVIGSLNNLVLRCVSSPGSSVSTSVNSGTAQPNIPINSQTYYLSLHVTDASGFSYWTGEQTISAGGYLVNAISAPASLSSSITLSPNPASDNVNVSINSTQNIVQVSDSSSTNSQITSSQNIVASYNISIYDNVGTLLFSANKSGNTFTIPISNLKEGTYIVKVIDSKQNYGQQLLMVKH